MILTQLGQGQYLPLAPGRTAEEEEEDRRALQQRMKALRLEFLNRSNDDFLTDRTGNIVTHLSKMVYPAEFQLTADQLKTLEKQIVTEQEGTANNDEAPRILIDALDILDRVFTGRSQMNNTLTTLKTRTSMEIQ